MTVKVDGDPLVVGDVPFTVNLDFRKFLTILFITNSMDEFCLGCPFISL